MARSKRTGAMRTPSILLAAAGAALAVTALLASCGTPTTPGEAQSAASARASIEASASAAVSPGFANISAHATPSTNITFSGAVSDTLTSANVLCMSGGQFFDIVGLTTGGKNVVLSGRLPSTVLLTYGGTAFTAHPAVGSGSGMVSAAASGGSFNSVTIPNADPNQSGQVTVNGTYSCTVS